MDDNHHHEHLAEIETIYNEMLDDLTAHFGQEIADIFPTLDDVALKYLMMIFSFKRVYFETISSLARNHNIELTDEQVIRIVELIKPYIDKLKT